MAKKEKVIFLCTQNSCRSQMAEGWLKHLAGDRFEVYSAGMEPRPIHPLAIKVMEEAGIDISAQEPTDVKDLVGRHIFTHIFFVCERAQRNCPRVYPSFFDQPYWPFEDPEPFEGTEEERLEKFREVRDKIRDRIKEWLEGLEKQSAS